MKTKEKQIDNREQETKSIFPEMKEMDMTAIDLKIRKLLFDEGYRLNSTENINIQAHKKVHNMTFIRGEGERVILYTHEPIKGKTA